MVTEQEVVRALATVQDPEIHRDLVSLNMIRNLRVDGAHVSFEVVLTTPACPLKTQIEQDCRQALGRIPGIGRIDIRMGAQVAAARFAGGCVTLTFEPGINYFYALRLFKNWRMLLIDRERLRVAGYLLSAYKAGHIHCHALMLGTNKEGKTLCDCDSREWEAAWGFFARIQTVTNSL